MADHRVPRSSISGPPRAKADRGGAPLPGADGGQVAVGRRLRGLRRRQGISMRSLAEMSGLNINTLSRIENHRSSPSVSTLEQLSQCLRVPLTEFFQTDRGSLEVVHQRHGERAPAPMDIGLMEDLAPGMQHPGPEPLILTLQGGANSGKTPIVHTGRELVYCLEGCVVYQVNEGRYGLEAGDSLCFEAYLPHSWQNPGPQPARVLLVLCPLDARDNPMDRHLSR